MRLDRYGRLLEHGIALLHDHHELHAEVLSGSGMIGAHCRSDEERLQPARERRLQQASRILGRSLLSAPSHGARGAMRDAERRELIDRQYGVLLQHLLLSTLDSVLLRQCRDWAEALDEVELAALLQLALNDASRSKRELQRLLDDALQES